MMQKRSFHGWPNSIRHWREHRNLTLERLVDRVVDSGQPLTAASLSRIERGVQPYSQPIIEALADALMCDPSDLVMRAPASKEQMELWSVIRNMTEDQQRQAVKILKALSEAA